MHQVHIKRGTKTEVYRCYPNGLLVGPYAKPLDGDLPIETLTNGTDQWNDMVAVNEVVRRKLGMNPSNVKRI